MNTPRFLTLLLSLVALAIFAGPAIGAPPSPKEEIAETAVWFDSVEWPDLAGKPYVELSFGTGFGRKTVDGLKIRGFLLDQDDKGYSIFSDGTLSENYYLRQRVWPCCIVRIFKPSLDDLPGDQIALRVIELPTAVEEVLADWRGPAAQSDGRHAWLPPKISNFTAVFALARFCARAGRKDLAERLDAELAPLLDPAPQIPGKRFGRFHTAVEKEVSYVLTWKTIVDLGDTRYTRPELLARFDRIVSAFPGSPYCEEAAAYAETLRTMIVEDVAHQQGPKPLGSPSVEEKVQELIFRLRDQNGHQQGQPGKCDIFEDSENAHPDSPAHQLVKIGSAAVPALIAALDDHRLSRTVGYGRDFIFSSYRVLTIGDCAAAVLSRIAGQDFSTEPSLTEMSDVERHEAVRRRIEAWWSGVQAGNEKSGRASGK